MFHPLSGLGGSLIWPSATPHCLGQHAQDLLRHGELEVEVSETLGAKVRVDHKSKGNGQIVISYNSLDELDGILEHIRK